MEIAERNRKIKAIVRNAFGCNVTVRGHKGTAYGWVTVNIDYDTKSSEQARELRGKVMQLLKAASVEIGTYGYDDPGSDYGHGSMIHINFNTPWVNDYTVR